MRFRDKLLSYAGNCYVVSGLFRFYFKMKQP